MQRLTQLGGHDMQVWRLSALFLQPGKVARRGQGRGTSVIFALDKFNAAFKTLSACQPVWCCLIDIYICALCKGFRIYIVWYREREKHTHKEAKILPDDERGPSSCLCSFQPPFKYPVPFFCNCFFGWHFRFRFRFKKKKEIRNIS